MEWPLISSMRSPGLRLLLSCVARTVGSVWNMKVSRPSSFFSMPQFVQLYAVTPNAGAWSCVAFRFLRQRGGCHCQQQHSQSSHIQYQITVGVCALCGRAVVCALDAAM